MDRLRLTGFFRICSAFLPLLLNSGCAQHSHAKPLTLTSPFQGIQQSGGSDDNSQQAVKKLLIIGDSMTGWMAERFNEYGNLNGFNVATVVWDGSTVAKWANSGKLEKIVGDADPDAVMVCLGMNEMFEANPESRMTKPVSDIIKAIGKRKLLWVGPPSWPGHPDAGNFNDWMAEELGESRYFRSDSIPIPRQSNSNPHPSRAGMEVWVDNIAEWIPDHSDLKFNSLEKPAKGKISRPQEFIYRKMKESL